MISRNLRRLLLPATLYGCGGGILAAVKHGGGVRHILFKGVSGCVIANMGFPLIADILPVSWHYTAFFFMGWGGLEAVDRLYGVIVSALESRVRNRMFPRGE